MVRLVIGNISPRVTVLLRTSERRGNVREGLEVGLNERKSGLQPLSEAPKEILGPKSRSSQHQVRGSPSGSLPAADTTKGVPLGIVKFGPGLIMGALLLTAVMEVQALPAPEVVKAWICSMLPQWKYGSL